MQRWWFALAALLVAGGVVLAGCGTAQPDTDVEMTMKEFGFDPEEVVLPAGEEVTLTLANDGDVRHEFMAGREVMTDGDTPNGYMEDFFHDVDVTVEPDDAVVEDDHDDHAGFMLLLEPGDRVEVTFTVPEDKVGEWEIGCFEPGHYDAGMHAALTVE